jgi:hypothetical protein
MLPFQLPGYSSSSSTPLSGQHPGPKSAAMVPNDKTASGSAVAAGKHACAVVVRQTDINRVFESLQVKLWDVSSEQPSLVAASDMGVGAIFSAAFCAESPFLVATGGAKVSPGLCM